MITVITSLPRKSNMEVKFDTLKEALPQIFQRTSPMLDPETQILLAVSFLRFHQIDAIPISFRHGQKERFAFFGYSCLLTLLNTDPRNYGEFLEFPIQKASLELFTVNANAKIEDLLRVFEKTHFGFTWVESDRLGGFASLRDLLDLYRSGIFSTTMTAGEIASPIYSLPKETSLKDVLQEMFDHKFRRVFV